MEKHITVMTTDVKRKITNSEISRTNKKAQRIVENS
jgi:hypothetical protein